MKKLCFLSFFLLSLTYTFGQELDLGLGISPHISWLVVDTKGEDSFTVENGGAKVGISYGIIADIYWDNYGFNTGIMHILLNGVTKPVNDTTLKESDYEWKLQYIEIPLALKLKTQEFSNGITYFGRFGVAPQIKIKEEIALATEIEGEDGEAKAINFHLILGGGINYALGGSARLLAGISYRNGFAKINKLEKYNLKTSYFSLDVGILF